jgi:hypothetical protein
MTYLNTKLAPTFDPANDSKGAETYREFIRYDDDDDSDDDAADDDDHNNDNDDC